MIITCANSAPREIAAELETIVTSLAALIPDTPPDSVITRHRAELLHRAGEAISHLRGVIPDREHTPVISAADTARLRTWLTQPTGSFMPAQPARVHFDACGGGVMVRTSP